MKNPVIEVNDLSFSYSEGSLVLDDVYLTIDQNDFIGVIGPNGGGKSTLIKILLGLLKPQKGKVTVFGLPPEKASHFIGYVPQFVKFNRNFPMVVEDLVMMGRLSTSRVFGWYTKEDHRAVRQCLLELEVDHLAKTPIMTLSGGQMQRVLIARALAGEVRVLFLDEPTASVDPKAERNIFDLLNHLHQRMPIVLVSHDVSYISKFVNKVACINKKLVCHTTKELSDIDISEVYGYGVKHVHHNHPEV